MICPKCGQESSGNFCSYCGVPLTEGPAKVPDSLKDDDVEMTEALAERESQPHNHVVRKSNGISRKEARSKSRKKPATDKAAQKSMRRRDTQINRLEGEVERLNRQQRLYGERELLEREGHSDEESGLKELAVKGVTGITVLSARLMQLACGILMAYMTWLLTASFWSGKGELGSLGTIIGDRNYKLAVYAAAAGCILFFGVLWTLWILSKKDGGGSVRLKKYDTGRGFIPFLLCLVFALLIPLVVSMVPPVEQITHIPQLAVDTHVWQELTAGVHAALHTIGIHRNTLLSCSALGLIFSIVRKILRV